MRFFTAAHTDVGIKKKTNQDSMCIKVARTKFGEVCLAVVCDGMGGLQRGELASATVVRRFSKWFNNELPVLMNGAAFSMETVKNDWETLINEQNDLLYRFGFNENIQLGTTLTAMLIIQDRYIIAQLGDSRAYLLDKKLIQLTKDQSVVARDLEKGLISEEQARKDQRRNILLQCLGVTKSIKTEYVFGQTKPETTFLLCSDGFRHEIYNDEIFGLLSPLAIKSEADIKNALIGLVELNKSRGETDNITAMLIKAIA